MKMFSIPGIHGKWKVVGTDIFNRPKDVGTEPIRVFLMEDTTGKENPVIVDSALTIVLKDALKGMEDIRNLEKQIRDEENLVQ